MELCSGQLASQLEELCGGPCVEAFCTDNGDLAGTCLSGDATKCALAFLNHQMTKATTDLAVGQDTDFLLMSGYLVFIMQLGFAMLCAGLVRRQGADAIMLKNVLDACVGGIMWYLVGYGFAFGAAKDDKYVNAFIGSWDFAIKDTVDSSFDDPEAYYGGKGYQSYFFQWAFSAATATIVSGAVAERCSFMAYLSYSAYMTAWVYPIVVHSVWSGQGWLSPWSKDWHKDEQGMGAPLILQTGAFDYAGSGVVHMTGGIAALVGAWITGPRVGRFHNGKPTPHFRGNSSTLVVLGTLLLWFGWLGFNPGSQLKVSGFANASIVARVAVTTCLSAAAGGLGMLLLTYFLTRTWDVVATCNGILSGLVAVTAGCALYEPWCAILCGFFSPIVFVFWERTLLRWQIDDAVGAFPLHGGVGMYGVLFVGLLAKPAYVETVYGQSGDHGGWFYGKKGELMLCQFIEVLFITAWVTINMSLFFGAFRFAGWLRTNDNAEPAPFTHESSLVRNPHMDASVLIKQGSANSTSPRNDHAVKANELDE